MKYTDKNTYNSKTYGKFEADLLCQNIEASHPASKYFTKQMQECGDTKIDSPLGKSANATCSDENSVSSAISNRLFSTLNNQKQGDDEASKNTEFFAALLDI